MEVQSPKAKTESTAQCREHEDNLINEANSILYKQGKTQTDRLSLIGLYLCMAVFLGAIVSGVVAESTIFSQLSFGTAIFAGLGVTRILK